MGKHQRYLVLLILSLGAVAIYFLPYLRWSFYDSLVAAVNLSNAQFAATMSIYGVTAMIFYAPGGYLADKLSPRKMLAFAYTATGALGLWYATYPGFTAQMVIFALWGGVGTAFFWSAMLRVTNSLGSQEEQGRMFGLLEGGRGVVNVVVAFVALYFFSKLGASVAGVTAIIIGTCVLCFLSSILIWFTVPDKLEGTGGDKIHLKDVGKVLKIPAVWIIAVIVLSCYSVYIGSTYLTPYMTEVLGVSATVAAAIAIMRTYVLQFLAGPTGGFVADKIGSISFVIACCFVLIAVSLAAFTFLPATSGMIVIAVIMMVLFSIGIFAMRGIYFAPIDECKVPKSLVGTAIGVISVIGFFPDVYMNAIVGNLMDAYPGVTGYKYVFFVMLAFSVIGLVAAVVLNRKIKRGKETNNDKTEIVTKSI